MRLSKAVVLACAVAAFFGGEALTSAAARYSAVSEDENALLAAKAAKQKAIDRQIWLSSPAAREARARSRHDYRGRMGERAYELAREKFGGLVAGPLWLPPRLSTDERKVGMNGDRVMVIERDGEPAGIVSSPVPLVARAPDGEKRPTDLRLEDKGGVFAATNPVARAEIPKVLSAPIRLEDGLSVHPLGGAADGTRGVLRDDRVFFADAADDTDLIIGAVPTGASVLYQLRSPNAPESLEMKLELPDGARIRQSDARTGGLEIVRGEELLVTIAPPLASDAQGVSVPVRYELSGDRVSISAAHAGGDYAYPILVDPLIDSQPWVYDGSGVHGWYFQTPWPDHFFSSTSGSWGSGMYTVLGAGRYYGHTAAGEWQYPMRPGTFMSRMEFMVERQSVYQPWANICHSIGFVNNASGLDQTTWWAGRDGYAGRGARTRCNSFDNSINFGYTAVCVYSDCSVPFTHEAHYAFFSTWTYGDATRLGWNTSYVGGSAAWISDSYGPNIGGGPPDIAYAETTAWPIYYADDGLGVRRLQVDSPSFDGWNQAIDWTFPCSGTTWSPCNTAMAGITREIGNLPPGANTIRVRVTDAGGRLSTKTWTIDNYPSSGTHGGSNQALDTEDEITSAIVALDPESTREERWNGFTASDREVLAAYDVGVRWGEDAPIENDGSEVGSREVFDDPNATAAAAEEWVPPADVYTSVDPGEPIAQASAFPIVGIVATCFKFCDDGVRAGTRLIKGLKKAKQPKWTPPTKFRPLKPSRRWWDDVTTKPSRKLRNNLKGKDDFADDITGDWQAHHIVAARHKAARMAQKYLDDCGIGPNDPRNGIMLPKNEATRSRLGTRRNAHPRTGNYYSNVNQMFFVNIHRSLSVDPCDAIRATLSEIKEALLKGAFRY